MTNVKQQRFLYLSFSNLMLFLNKEDIIPYVGKMVKELNAIDNDLTIMDTCYHVDLKTRKKTVFKDNDIPKFQSKVLSKITDITGTELLIFNN